MIYIKIKPDYNSRQFSAKIIALINNCALNPPAVWDVVTDKPDTYTIPCGYELIVPAKVAEILPGGWYFVRSYTSEELAPLYEDKILFNEKTQCAVPNQALWNIEEVRVESDLCTDLLQDLLEKGWHIMAICPQARRRPDYVLGRGSEISKQKLVKAEPVLQPPPAHIEDTIPF